MLFKGFYKLYYEVAILHAVLGTTAELLGLYIVIVAGTNVLPQWLRFKHWKWWMRTELVLWAIVLLSGIGTYCAWYVAPFSSARYWAIVDPESENLFISDTSAS